MTTANGLDDTTDLRRLLARLMIAEFPGLALLHARTYKVIQVYSDPPNYGRCDLALDSDPEQQIPRVDQWPGIPGGVGLPAVGSLCEVTWRDGAQRSPVIVGFQPLRTIGGKPSEVNIDADSVRIGPTATSVKLAGGNWPIALANLVDARFSVLASIVGQIAGKLNVAGPVVGAPGTVALFTPASVAASKVTGQ